MVPATVRAVSLGCRDRASEPDASACFGTDASCPRSRLFTYRKPTPLLSHASKCAQIVHISAMIATSAIYLASRLRARRVRRRSNDRNLRLIGACPVVTAQTNGDVGESGDPAPRPHRRCVGLACSRSATALALPRQRPPLP